MFIVQGFQRYHNDFMHAAITQLLPEATSKSEIKSPCHYQIYKGYFMPCTFDLGNTNTISTLGV